MDRAWLNLGCGPMAARGWINCDVRAEAGVDVRIDLRRSLPFADGRFAAIAAIHVLQDLEWDRIAPLLRELHRALMHGGVLRIAVPDLDRAIAAYRARDAAYFYVPDDDASSVGAKLVTQIIWYGSVRTPFTYEFLEEWLRKAGFRDVARRAFGESILAGLAELDNRERETLFVEATRT